MPTNEYESDDGGNFDDNNVGDNDDDDDNDFGGNAGGAAGQSDEEQPEPDQVPNVPVSVLQRRWGCVTNFFGIRYSGSTAQCRKKWRQGRKFF